MVTGYPNGHETAEELPGQVVHLARRQVAGVFPQELSLKRPRSGQHGRVRGLRRSETPVGRRPAGSRLGAVAALGCKTFDPSPDSRLKRAGRHQRSTRRPEAGPGAAGTVQPRLFCTGCPVQTGGVPSRPACCFRTLGTLPDGSPAPATPTPPTARPGQGFRSGDRPGQPNPGPPVGPEAARPLAAVRSPRPTSGSTLPADQGRRCRRCSSTPRRRLAGRRTFCGSRLYPLVRPTSRQPLAAKSLEFSLVSPLPAVLSRITRPRRTGRVPARAASFAASARHGQAGAD